MITSLAGVLEAILQSRSIPTQERVMRCVTKNTHKIGDIIDSKNRRHAMLESALLFNHDNKDLQC